MSARKEFERNVGKVEDSRHKMNHFVNHSYNKHETVRSTSPNRHGVQGDASLRMRLSGQLDRPSPPVGSKLHSVPALDIEESLATLHGQGVEEDGRGNFRRHENRSRDEAGSPTNQMIGRRGQDDLAEQLMNSVRLKDEPEKNNSGQFNNSYDKVSPVSFFTICCLSPIVLCNG
ncbi:hypothetical protein IFM89_020966 [Coptis chinensis]|uniref:Uncharacterized protein n=1 Tax=Coptis chinensis TaxID=261450 RepID=A0A835IDF6_9MAGN|nr:hypothetical protein IFM89_020966 [Coptis chinensis]